MKKVGFIILITVLALVFSYLVVPGFFRQANATVTDFAVSEDGSEMVILVGVAQSVGYVRAVSQHQQSNGKLCLDCYSAFGGINGSWGAKRQYTIQLHEDTKTIAVWSSADNDYRTILKKDKDGEWKFANR